ncbi:hypothetical protein HanXRQr2_Chr14g0629571 [Helianthus annuus]|uniref:Uncharacterized protein n=1 Tax=Helianthus annuus TaxID=4232 RepID=A0A9K3E860_HELAN|nr:hypothetical protein HanXRQr2_Chr14g0629571 [Helianthus annuus]KAJ0839178.1 hypothetical protein HanPSC8_Chr14g0603801 [Helianthus annuus]
MFHFFLYQFGQNSNYQFEFQIVLVLYIYSRVKCYFSPCGLFHFASLVQRFHFSHVGPKIFHCCDFSPLG